MDYSQKLFFLIIHLYILSSLSSYAYVTQTVYGFLDFTTTIENTVMIFSPQTAPKLELKPKIKLSSAVIETKPSKETVNAIKPTRLGILDIKNSNEIELSKENSKLTITNSTSTNVQSTKWQENVILQPEYNNLSRQPPEYAEESYRILKRKTNHNGKITNSITNVSENSRNSKIKKSKLRSNTFSHNSDTVTGRSSFSTKHYRHKSNSIEPINAVSVLPKILGENTKRHKKSRTRDKSKRRSSIQSFKSSNENYGHIVPTTLSESSIRRTFKTKVTIIADSNTDNALKLNRMPSRWQYKSSPKPRVTIRNSGNISNINNQSLNNTDANIVSNAINTNLTFSDIAISNTENDPRLVAETLNVEISTPSNNNGIFYEILTLKTPYIFQAGVVKKTRFVTVTSTIEKQLSTLDNMYPENILTMGLDSIPLENSIKTLEPIHLTDTETPSLETVVESFTTRITKIQTQILPLVYDVQNITKLLTLVETKDFASQITITKTVHPYQQKFFESQQNFKDFSGILDEAGSEITLEVNENDENNDSPLIIANDLNNNVTNKQTISNYALKVNGDISKSNGDELSTAIPSISNIFHTNYQTDATTPLQFSYPMSVNPFILPQQNPFQTIISSLVHHTTVVQTNSKVLKLTFGARTAYTTLFSSTEIPTLYTQFITQTVPVIASAAFPGYYPPPYNPYAYIG